MSARPAPGWWIRAAGRAYGPFASERLPGFVREGRLTPETQVARDEAGPWLAAALDPSLDELFTAPRRVADAPRRPAPAAATTPAAVRSVAAPRAQDGEPGALVEATHSSPQPALASALPSAPGRTFLVFAELLEGREPAFAQRLGLAGQVARARPGLWLLRAGGEPAALRNALSQGLGEGESLMVVEAAAPDAAWFNLGGEADRALRALWTPPGAQPAGRRSAA